MKIIYLYKVSTKFVHKPISFYPENFVSPFHTHISPYLPAPPAPFCSPISNFSPWILTPTILNLNSKLPGIN